MFALEFHPHCVFIRCSDKPIEPFIRSFAYITLFPYFIISAYRGMEIFISVPWNYGDLAEDAVVYVFHEDTYYMG